MFLIYSLVLSHIWFSISWSIRALHFPKIIYFTKIFSLYLNTLNTCWGKWNLLEKHTHYSFCLISMVTFFFNVLLIFPLSSLSPPFSLSFVVVLKFEPSVCLQTLIPVSSSQSEGEFTLHRSLKALSGQQVRAIKGLLSLFLFFQERWPVRLVSTVWSLGFLVVEM